jgi:hypothetical protein
MEEDQFWMVGKVMVSVASFQVMSNKAKED